jgi:phage-related protein
MAYDICYYSDELQAEILAMPAGILADYLRLADLLIGFGPQLRLPHSRAMGEGLFELRPKGREGIGRVFYCYLFGQRIVMLHTLCEENT